MSYTIPSDAHASGDTGHISDHNNLADVLTALGNANLSLYVAASGATAETIPGGRFFATSATTTLATQQLYLVAIGLHQNTTVSNISFCVKSTSTGGATITHAWYCLVDNGDVIRAISADQAGSSSFMATTNTVYTLAMASPFTTTYSGLYYLGVMVECGTMPNLATAGTPAAGLTSATPVLAGTSGTATQTTPPATGTSVTAPTAAGGFIPYAWTS